jgi:hypothetical protein
LKVLIGNDIYIVLNTIKEFVNAEEKHSTLSWTFFVVERARCLGKATSETDAKLKILVESLVNYGGIGVESIFQIDKVSIVDIARPSLVGL